MEEGPIICYGLRGMTLNISFKSLKVDINAPLLQIRKLNLRGFRLEIARAGVETQVCLGFKTPEAHFQGDIWRPGFLHTFPTLGEFSIMGVDASLRYDLETCYPNLPGSHDSGM